MSIERLYAQLAHLTTQIDNGISSPQARAELFDELDRTQAKVADLAQNATPFEESSLADIKNRIISLRGLVDASYLEGRITSIETNDHITEIYKEYRPSTADRNRIQPGPIDANPHADLDEITDLFNTARSFLKEDRVGGIWKYNMLPEHLKTVVQRHMKDLGVHHLRPLQDTLVTAQALFAAAHETAGINQPIFTEEQMQAFFADMDYDLTE